MLEFLGGLFLGLLFSFFRCTKTSTTEFRASTRKWDHINAQIVKIKLEPIIVADTQIELQAAFDEIDKRQNTIGYLQALDPQDPKAPWNQPCL